MEDWKNFRPNQEIICTASRGFEGALTTGHVYRCMYGTEEGILAYRPFVTVVDDNGHTLSCHASRFRPAPTGENND